MNRHIVIGLSLALLAATAMSAGAAQRMVLIEYMTNVA